MIVSTKLTTCTVAVLEAIRAIDSETPIARNASHIHRSKSEIRKLTLHRLHAVRTDSVISAPSTSIVDN